MSDIVFKAMVFARDAHAHQKRRYTGAPYFTHLSEVVGLVASVTSLQHVLATAWLHDVIEDQNVQWARIYDEFGKTVADGVQALSDRETGSRAERKRLSNQRLALAPSWAQTVKVADIISNTCSIKNFDSDFAKVYIVEKKETLGWLVRADESLWKLATEQLAEL